MIAPLVPAQVPPAVPPAGAEAVMAPFVSMPNVTFPAVEANSTVPTWVNVVPALMA